jgi:hypothetical protein
MKSETEHRTEAALILYRAGAGKFGWSDESFRTIVITLSDELATGQILVVTVHRETKTIYVNTIPGK